MCLRATSGRAFGRALAAVFGDAFVDCRVAPRRSFGVLVGGGHRSGCRGAPSCPPMFGSESGTAQILGECQVILT